MLVLAFIGFFAMIARQPSTDKKRPEGVTEEQFEKDPTFGKLQIAKFGNVYKYYDTVFNGMHAWDKYPIHGFTLSKTPPDADVKVIKEIYTTHQVTVLSTPEIVSRDREIPRDHVIPLPYQLGDYYGSDVGETYYYSPPATASRYELEKAAALLKNGGR